LLKALFPNTATTLAEVGQAMINITLHGYARPIIEVPDILTLAHEPT
jgi:hypothetical protein